VSRVCSTDVSRISACPLICAVDLQTTRWNVRHLILVPRVAATVGAPEGGLLPSQWTGRELASVAREQPRLIEPSRNCLHQPCFRPDHAVLSGPPVNG
jgi:hypothetical protein